jgi:hypothetical protein
MGGYTETSGCRPDRADDQNFNHFTGVDYDAKTETTAIFKVRLHTTKDKGE